tara:strand:+ start:531 stop:1076 length:546 start_codon:yes stop_codon:yes gene_type:complete
MASTTSYNQKKHKFLQDIVQEKLEKKKYKVAPLYIRPFDQELKETTTVFNREGLLETFGKKNFEKLLKLLRTARGLNESKKNYLPDLVHKKTGKGKGKSFEFTEVKTGKKLQLKEIAQKKSLQALTALGHKVYIAHYPIIIRVDGFSKEVQERLKKEIYNSISIEIFWNRQCVLPFGFKKT